MTPTPEQMETAKIFLTQYLFSDGNGFGANGKKFVISFKNQLAKLLASEREKALEECATLAEKMVEVTTLQGRKIMVSNNAKSIALEIRNLKERG